MLGMLYAFPYTEYIPLSKMDAGAEPALPPRNIEDS